MKCRFFQTHPLGWQRRTNSICLSVSKSSGIRSKKKGSISRESNFGIAQSYHFFVSFINGETEKGHLSYLTVELISFFQYCCDPYNIRAMMHAV